MVGFAVSWSWVGYAESNMVTQIK